MKEISFGESREIEDAVYIDVRSPAEFEEDHASGAVNVPLFDNSERKEIGTIYRIAGREDAIVRGTEIVGGKLKDIMEEILRFREKNIIVMCARGGMRSASLASLLDSLGMKVWKITGGYKGYRHDVMDRIGALALPAPPVVLQGLTGAGKTEIIRRIPHSIDLEEMAGHRSSVFGGIDKTQKTQKRFETLIVERVGALAGAPWILIEGESRKIGNLHLPDVLHAAMKAAPAIYLDTPIERRVEIIYDEYHSFCDDENIPRIVEGLTVKLGQKTIEKLLGFYRDGEIREFIRVLLEKYYDPLYRHSLEKKDYLAVVRNDDTETALEQVCNCMETYIQDLNKN